VHGRRNDAAAAIGAQFDALREGQHGGDEAARMGEIHVPRTVPRDRFNGLGKLTVLCDQLLERRVATTVGVNIEDNDEGDGTGNHGNIGA